MTNATSQSTATMTAPVTASAAQPIGTVPTAVPPVATPAAGIPRPAGQPLPNVSKITAVRRPWLAIFAMLAVFIALIGSFVLYFMRVSTQSKITQAETSIKKYNEQLSTGALAEVAQRVGTINGALQGYATVTKTQLDYRLLIDHLVQITPKDVRIDTLTVDEQGGVRLVLIAPNYESAGKAHLSYRSSVFMESINLDSVAMGDKEKQVSLSLSGILKKDRLDPRQVAAAAESSAVQSPAPTATAGNGGVNGQ